MRNPIPCPRTTRQLQHLPTPKQRRSFSAIRRRQVNDYGKLITLVTDLIDEITETK